MPIFDGSTWSFLHSSPPCESTEAKESESFKKMVDCCEFCRSRQQPTLLPQLKELKQQHSPKTHTLAKIFIKITSRGCHDGIARPDAAPFSFPYAPMLTGRKPLKCFNSFDCGFLSYAFSVMNKRWSISWIVIWWPRKARLLSIQGKQQKLNTTTSLLLVPITCYAWLSIENKKWPWH